MRAYLPVGHRMDQHRCREQERYLAYFVALKCVARDPPLREGMRTEPARVGSFRNRRAARFRPARIIKIPPVPTNATREEGEKGRAF